MTDSKVVRYTAELNRLIGVAMVAAANGRYVQFCDFDRVTAECDALRRENEQLKKQAKCSHGPWADNYTYCTSCGFYDVSRAQ